MGFVSEWRAVDCEECTGQLVNKQNKWAEMCNKFVDELPNSMELR